MMSDHDPRWREMRAAWLEPNENLEVYREEYEREMEEEERQHHENTHVYSLSVA